MAGRARTLLLVAIAALYLVSIPWYRPAGAVPETWFGLPDWVAVAIVCYAAAAVLNALAWFGSEISDEAPEADDPSPADDA